MAGVVQINTTLSIPESEIAFQFSRSTGPGGQNVNKVSTRADLLFDIRSSPGLSEHQRSRLMEVLGSRIGKDGILRVTAQASRSQWQNREEALEKFKDLLKRALAPQKKRRATKPTVGSRERRVRRKKLQSLRKKNRAVVGPPDNE